MFLKQLFMQNLVNSRQQVQDGIKMCTKGISTDKTDVLRIVGCEALLKFAEIFESDIQKLKQAKSLQKLASDYIGHSNLILQQVLKLYDENFTQTMRKYVSGILAASFSAKITCQRTIVIPGQPGTKKGFLKHLFQEVFKQIMTRNLT